MQEVTLWFWAALSVVLIVTSFVDGQEVILVADPDISPIGQVRKSLIVIGIHPKCLKLLRATKCGTGHTNTVTTEAADVICSEDRISNYF